MESLEICVEPESPWICSMLGYNMICHCCNRSAPDKYCPTPLIDIRLNFKIHESTPVHDFVIIMIYSHYTSRCFCCRLADNEYWAPRTAATEPTVA